MRYLCKAGTQSAVNYLNFFSNDIAEHLQGISFLRAVTWKVELLDL